jgi:hypothetical protein
MSDRSPRRPGVSLLGTARDQDEANDWQGLLLDGGIQSVVRGHREEGSTERRPAFSGLDLYVPATALGRARDILSPVAEDGQLTEDEQGFPWVWLFVAPVAIIIVAVIVLIAVLA